MAKLLITAAVAVLTVGAVAQPSCMDAYDMCIFSFEGAKGIPTYAAGSPGSAISPPIIYKADGLSSLVVGPSPSGGVSPGGLDIVGSVDATAEPYVITDSGPVLISKYDCPSQPFSSSFFKATGLGNSPLGYPLSAASHETPQGDQVDCLDGLCVVLTIKKWQSFTPDGVLNLVSDPADLLTNCAVFKLSA